MQESKHLAWQIKYDVLLTCRASDPTHLLRGGNSTIGQPDLQPITKGAEFGAEAAGTPTHEVIQQRHAVTKALFVRTDVTVGTDVDRLVREAVKVGGRLDVWVISLLVPRLKVSEDRIVNNAGIGGTEHHGMVHEMSEDVWDTTMNVNSRSVFLGCKYACGQFLRQEPHASGHRGWIINTASIMGLVGQKVNGGKAGRASWILTLTSV
ncbi:MAG: hypothetical protein LQ349_002543 [Xanthoria aureola]|nr:MAG: hypothetical protein LQ349_002543 [Xanthoria aureola]